MDKRIETYSVGTTWDEMIDYAKKMNHINENEANDILDQIMKKQQVANDVFDKVINQTIRKQRIASYDGKFVNDWLEEENKNGWYIIKVLEWNEIDSMGTIYFHCRFLMEREG